MESRRSNRSRRSSLEIGLVQIVVVVRLARPSSSLLITRHCPHRRSLVASSAHHCLSSLSLQASLLDCSSAPSLKEKFMSKLNRDDIRLNLERIVDRRTMEVQTLDTEGHGQLIQETEGNEPAEQNKVKDTALIATKKRLKRQEAIRKMVDLNFVVATIIASVTYAAVIQVPGGYDNNGEANLRKKNDFKLFMFFNAYAFVFSLLSMLFHFCIGHVSLSSSISLIYASLCFTFTQFSLLGITGAFFSSIRAVLTKSSTPKSDGKHGDRAMSSSNVVADYRIGILFLLTVFFIFAAVVLRMKKKIGGFNFEGVLTLGPTSTHKHYMFTHSSCNRWAQST